MRSIWSLYKEVRGNVADTANIAGNASSITGLTITVNSGMGANAGSSTQRVMNVASVPTTIPAAGIMVWDSTLKVLAISDGTSFHSSGGSLSVT